jgi:putative Holliday junction resolvase
MRVLAIDFGEARIGLAITDPAGRMAIPLTTLLRTSDRDAIRQIGEIVIQEDVELMLIGEPRHMDGSLGDAAMRVRSFKRKLSRQVPLPCESVDETLTSVAALERLRDAGVNPRRHPERIDAVAAQILLEQYLAAPPEARDG